MAKKKKGWRKLVKRIGRAAGTVLAHAAPIVGTVVGGPLGTAIGTAVGAGGAQLTGKKKRSMTKRALMIGAASFGADTLLKTVGVEKGLGIVKGLIPGESSAKETVEVGQAPDSRIPEGAGGGEFDTGGSFGSGSTVEGGGFFGGDNKGMMIALGVGALALFAFKGKKSA